MNKCVCLKLPATAANCQLLTFKAKNVYRKLVTQIE